MVLSGEELGMEVLGVLYSNMDRESISDSDLAEVIDVPGERVKTSLGGLVDSGLVDAVAGGYRLSEAGFRVVHQRVTSFCPHL